MRTSTSALAAAMVPQTTPPTSRHRCGILNAVPSLWAGDGLVGGSGCSAIMKQIQIHPRILLWVALGALSFLLWYVNPILAPEAPGRQIKVAVFLSCAAGWMFVWDLGMSLWDATKQNRKPQNRWKTLVIGIILAIIFCGLAVYS